MIEEPLANATNIPVSNFNGTYLHSALAGGGFDHEGAIETPVVSLSARAALDLCRTGFHEIIQTGLF